MAVEHLIEIDFSICLFGASNENSAVTIQIITKIAIHLFLFFLHYSYNVLKT